MKIRRRKNIQAPPRTEPIPKVSATSSDFLDIVAAKFLGSGLSPTPSQQITDHVLENEIVHLLNGYGHWRLEQLAIDLRQKWNRELNDRIAELEEQVRRLTGEDEA